MKLEDIPPEAGELCEAFGMEVEKLFGDRLHGVYLYGAVVFPDSGPIQDLDFHVVLKSSLADSERSRAVAIHEDLARRFPGLGEELDAYFITVEDARQPGCPVHQLNLLVRDESWALHCAHIRAAALSP
jgi:hypothetical protein